MGSPDPSMQPGWCYATPTKAATHCRHCKTVFVKTKRGNVRICIVCDFPETATA